MSSILARMSELATLAKDVTKNAGDVELYQQEFTALQDQLRTTIGGSTAEIGGTTDIDTPLGAFNGITLFGPNSAGLKVTIGQAVGQEMTIRESNLRTGPMGDIIAQDAAGAYTLDLADAGAIAKLTDAIQHIATERAGLGAAQSRLELAASTLRVEYENLEAAISRIRDVDVAEESTKLAKYNVLVRSGTAMLAQANQLPQNVLSLLQQ
jgi:flagellin